MAHIFHGEIDNERDPNRKEGHDHKANQRKNGYEQVHGSPPDAWLGRRPCFLMHAKGHWQAQQNKALQRTHSGLARA